MEPAISVHNLSKCYKLGVIGRQALVDEVRYWWLKMRGRDPREYFSRIGHSATEARRIEAEQERLDRFWALKDISFDVQPGEVVGIIGKNGAGKSTLLKILSRITEPTDGEIVLNGRVSSLLEVGTGFHPELTGRENIYLNGTILGMKKKEIDDKFDEIVSFSEIEKFIDTPVKRYSSGMYVRLAFSVAAHLEPEILLVDEVLAVGDAVFQKKCLGKMGDVAKEGRTVLFVSHNMGTIHSLTKNCIYLKDGQVSVYDSTFQVVERYLTDVLEHRQKSEADLAFYRRDPLAESPVRFTRIWVNEQSNELPRIDIGAGFSIIFEIEVNREIHGANLALTIKNIQGIHPVVLLFSWDQDFWLSINPGIHKVELRVDDLPLAPGQYFVSVGVNQSTQTVAYDSIVDFPLLQVVNNGQIVHWLDRPWGSVHWVKTRWRLLE